MVRDSLLLLAAAPLCSGHVSMNYPPSWLDTEGRYGLKDGTYDGSGQPDWRDAGCVKGTGRKGGDGAQSDAKHCIVHWYTNNTFIPGERTLPDSMQGFFPIINPKNPWYAPGTAPVFGGGCGIDGGNPHGCPPGNSDPFSCAGGGRGHGEDARTLQYSYTKLTEWKVGEEVELMYGIEANHAGGYQYRLCPKPATSNMDLTEECFQKTPLTLTTDKAWVQYHGDRSNRTAFKPLRTTVGTHPPGSQWSRNAIPACKGVDGGVADILCVKGPMFPPPAPHVYGFWGVYNLGQKFLGMGPVHSYSIVDILKVPDVPKGVYVLSMRYDAEQTSQVWNMCADVKIV